MAGVPRPDFAGEADQIALLQELVGYFAANNTSQEKITLFLGPPRSGKGTITNVLRELLGANFVIGPSLKSPGERFGLHPLVGKQLAIIDDLRLSKRGANTKVVGNLLKISGRGYFTLDRKYKSAWTGALPVNLLITSNELPELGDRSGTIATRFIVLMTRTSFLGRSQDAVRAPASAGAACVLHWALDGLRRLRERGHFPATEASREGSERMADLASPVRAFVGEMCVLDAEAMIIDGHLFVRWSSWSEANKVWPGTKDQFLEASMRRSRWRFGRSGCARRQAGPDDPGSEAAGG